MSGSVRRHKPKTQFPDLVVIENGQAHSCRLLDITALLQQDFPGEYYVEEYRGWSCCLVDTRSQVIHLKMVGVGS